MRLYHGSEFIIEKPKYGQGKINNDYGRGFYCTEDINLAKEWAVEENRNGYVNVYDLDVEGLTVTNLNDKNYDILHWISVLLANREFQLNYPISIEAKKYLLNNYLLDFSKSDVIRGYRADDSYFTFARDFLNNAISLEQLNEAMHYGGLGEQIVLKSEKSFNRICFVDSIEVDRTIWFPKRESRDSLARLKYFNLEKRTFKRSDTYILDLLNGEQ